MNKSITDINENELTAVEKLTSREKEFCRIFAETRDKRRSAYEAGYKILPNKSALKLLEKQKVRNYLDSILNKQDGFHGEVEAGFRRLAFGSSADAVKLLFSDNLTDEQIESLDLFNVSDIKKPKGGGIEIKFFDRLKALEMLSAVSNEKSDGALPFYKALEKSVTDMEEDEI
jgi:hypothetical protein